MSLSFPTRDAGVAGSDRQTLTDAIARVEAGLYEGALDRARQDARDAAILACAPVDTQRISLNAALAWLYGRLAAETADAGFVTKSIGYAQSALLLDPSDVLAFAVLPAHEAELVAQNLLRHRKPDRARAILERLSGRSGFADYCLQLMEFVSAERDRIVDTARPPPQGAAPLLINVIVWGNAYVDALFAYAFASLLARGNIPAVSAEREVVFDVYTSQRDAERICSHPVTLALKRYARFRFNIVPDGLLDFGTDQAARWCAGAMQLLSALRARQVGADLLFLCGSGVYSRECLSRAYHVIGQGYRAVACAMPRTQERSRYAALRNYARISGGCIETDADRLSEFIVHNLHDYSLACFISDEPRFIAQNPVTLFFRTREGFCCRTYQPSPLIVSNDLLLQEIDFDYFTIDVRFLSGLLGSGEDLETIRIVTNPADGIVVSDVDCGRRAPMLNFGDISLSVETCIGGALLTATRTADIAFLKRSLDHRILYRGSGNGVPLPDDGLPENSVMRAAERLIDEGMVATLRRIGFYERLADFN